MSDSKATKRATKIAVGVFFTVMFYSALLFVGLAGLFKGVLALSDPTWLDAHPIAAAGYTTAWIVGVVLLYLLAQGAFETLGDYYRGE